MIAVHTSSPVLESQLPTQQIRVETYLASLPVTSLDVFGPLSGDEVDPLWPKIQNPDLIVSVSLAGIVGDYMSKLDFDDLKKKKLRS